VAQIPGKLAIWGRALSQRAEHAQALTSSVQALAYRMQDLIEARVTPQTQRLTPELSSQVRAWRIGLQEILSNLSRQPEATDVADLRARLDATLGRLDAQVEKAVAGADQTSGSIRESENSFRLLGAFRGVSEAVVDFARQATKIDWVHLREERF
jgi:hypothetical protein